MSRRSVIGVYEVHTRADPAGDLANGMRGAYPGAHHQVSGGVCWEAPLEGTTIGRLPPNQSWLLLGTLDEMDKGRVREIVAELGHA